MNWGSFRFSPSVDGMMKGLGLSEEYQPPSLKQNASLMPDNEESGMNAITGGVFNLSAKPNIGSQNNLADDIINSNGGGFTTSGQKPQSGQLLNAPQVANDPLMNQNSMLNEGFWKQLFSMFGGGFGG